jgi:TM2 domain-containing membrane protein YozV
MGNVMRVLPDLEGDEMVYVQGLISDLDDNQSQLFATAYRARRKDPQTLLFTTLLGFFGVAGIQRFVVGQVGMGLLFLFTGGFCLVGTVIDLVKHKRLAFAYNQGIGQQVLALVRSAN